MSALAQAAACARKLAAMCVSPSCVPSKYKTTLPQSAARCLNQVVKPGGSMRAIYISEVPSRLSVKIRYLISGHRYTKCKGQARNDAPMRRPEDHICYPARFPKADRRRASHPFKGVRRAALRACLHLPYLRPELTLYQSCSAGRKRAATSSCQTIDTFALRAATSSEKDDSAGCQPRRGRCMPQKRVRRNDNGTCTAETASHVLRSLLLAYGDASSRRSAEHPPMRCAARHMCLAHRSLASKQGFVVCMYSIC